MINIAEILKDCPKGMELDCTIWDNVVLAHVDINSKYPIWIKKMEGEIEFLTENGCFNFDCSAKCVIFPKGKTTWEGFMPPCEFKDGDVLVHTQNGRFVMSIYKSNENEKLINTHVIFWDREDGLSIGMQICCYIDNIRFATEEEKQKLFDAIKSNGYYWNAEAKTLEKLVEPKFKVGDIVMSKINQYEYTIADINKDGYKVCYYGNNKLEYHVPFCNEDDFTLVSNKFNFSTLKPFESRVLVRDNVDEIWFPCFFGGLSNNSDYPYRIVGGESWKYCIPYEGNEHLLNKRDDCDEYYKN